MTKATSPDQIVIRPPAETLAEGFRQGVRDRTKIEFLSHGIAMVLLVPRVFKAFADSLRHARFPFEELLLQTWYTIRVCTLPALAVSIPFGVVLALQVGVL